MLNGWLSHTNLSTDVEQQATCELRTPNNEVRLAG